MTKLTCKKILLTPAKITHDNIYTDNDRINSCGECIYKSYCSYVDLIPKYMPMCIRFSIDKNRYAIDDDHLNLYVPIDYLTQYHEIIIEGKQCTN